MTELEVVVQRDDARAVVHVHGELDLSTAPDLRDRLAELIAEGVLDVTVDMAALDFIDSSGLNVLVSALKRLRGAGGELVLRSPQPTAVSVFEITGLNTVFTCVNSDHRLGWRGAAHSSVGESDSVLDHPPADAAGARDDR